VNIENSQLAFIALANRALVAPCIVNVMVKFFGRTH
jgi:hypothetical protein